MAVYFPVANLPQSTDDFIFNEERSAAGRERVKQKVLDHMRRTADIGEWDMDDNLTVVHQESDQRMLYRPDAPWRFNELQSRVEEDGQVRESVALMRQLFAAEPWRYSALLRVNEMVKECWLASDNCVLMQLSAHLAISRDTLEDRLNDIHDNWQEEGIMPRDILELGKALQRSVYILGENR